jgi:protein-tyrosine-phosphatase
MKKRVLFICVHNSARSQMAEAWLDNLCGEYFEAQSAGLEPGTLNPVAVRVMTEVGDRYFEKENAGRLRCLHIRPAIRLCHHGVR